VHFQLRFDVNLDEAVREVLQDELTEAQQAVRDPSDRDEAVHESRKAFKRARALLRLVRSGLDSDVRKRENRALRDLGRRLSDVRDAAVLVKSLDALLAEHADAVQETTYAGLRELLVSEHAAVRVRQLAAGGEATAVADALDEVLGRIAELHVDSGEVVEKGLRRSCERARKRLDAARDELSVEAFHELRKRVKDLRYHVELLQHAWPEILEPYEGQLHELTDRLGDDHDLAVLREAIEQRPGGFRTPADQQLLMDLLDQRRAALQTEAFALASLVLAERPKGFARRVTAYIDVAAGRA
jgi:CHAD domain-containing protein